MTNTSKITLTAAVLSAAFTLGCTTHANSYEFYPTAEQRAETEAGAARIQGVEANARKIQHEKRMSEAEAIDRANRHRWWGYYYHPRYYWWR